MIPFQEAYDTVMAAARLQLTEPVDYRQSVGRILAQDIHATMPMPPFDKAMVDGYACRRADLHEPLTLLETIQAGYGSPKPIEAGQCSKIMTGAVVPEGADCVFMVEQSAEDDGTVRFTGETTNDNIVPLAKDVQKNDLLLPTGHRIHTHDVAVLASMGHLRPMVYCQPSVGIVATGDELVEPEFTPGPAQIRNSNAYHLAAQVESIGLTPTYEGIARDDQDSLDAKIGSAIANNDVVLISGGVSMGEFDLVPGVLKKNGITIVFDKVAVQPGKPTVFGYSDSTFCFGLPGNPVSSYVIFETLVKPFLFKLMDYDYRPPTLRAPLADAFTRKAGTRSVWFPVTFTEEGTVRRMEYHGSAHINALSGADGLACVPQGITELGPGEAVTVRLIRM